jgi:hypothetical protein
MPEMIKALGALEPAMISFGSPVNSWVVEPLVPVNLVIYGNMSTKRFYADGNMPLDRVKELAHEIEAKLKGHRTFILGWPGMRHPSDAGPLAPSWRRSSASAAAAGFSQGGSANATVRVLQRLLVRPRLLGQFPDDAAAHQLLLDFVHLDAP